MIIHFGFDFGSWLTNVQRDPETDKIHLNIGGMTCSSCANAIESVVGGGEGVVEISVNLALEKATVKYDSNKTGVRTIIQEIEDVCVLQRRMSNRVS